MQSYLTGDVSSTALTEGQQVAQSRLEIVQEEHAEKFNQARADFDARIATLVRLNDANASIAKHKFEEDMAAAQAQYQQQLVAYQQQQQQYQQQLAAYQQQQGGAGAQAGAAGYGAAQRPGSYGGQQRAAPY